MKKRIFSVLPCGPIGFAFAVLLVSTAFAQTRAQSAPGEPWTARMADSAITRWPDGRITMPDKPSHWNDELGILLTGIDAAWYNTADPRYFHYVQNTIDSFVSRDGSLTAAVSNASILDQTLLGRQLLLLYGVTQNKRYYIAAEAIRDRFALQLNASSSVSGQIFGDRHPPGLGPTMAAPFLAEYASVLQEPQGYPAITRLFGPIGPASRTRYPANAKPTLEVAFTLMALVDTLPSYPVGISDRAKLLQTLRFAASDLVRRQDAETGLWQGEIETSGKVANSFRSAANCTFTYVLAKAVRLGYLPRGYESNTARAWTGIQQHLLEPIGESDPVTSGACLLASTEMDDAQTSLTGSGKVVLLDAWYNSQTRKNAAGQTILFHYKWDDFSDSGFALLGHIFRSHGAKTETLVTAPTAENLKGSSFYIIVSPDNPAKNPDPHYMNAQDAARIAAWVERGGVLILMENDRDNADIPQLDLLADKFGLHFNNVLTHHVIGDRHEMGKIMLTQPMGIFHRPHTLFMKDTCSLTLSRGAQSLLQWEGDTLMAMACYGKGTVFAVTDPWLYNEYTDGRNLGPEYDNFAAGQELVRWLLQQH